MKMVMRVAGLCAVLVLAFAAVNIVAEDDMSAIEEAEPAVFAELRGWLGHKGLERQIRHIIHGQHTFGRVRAPSLRIRAFYARVLKSLHRRFRGVVARIRRRFRAKMRSCQKNSSRKIAAYRRRLAAQKRSFSKRVRNMSRSHSKRVRNMSRNHSKRLSNMSRKHKAAMKRKEAELRSRLLSMNRRHNSRMKKLHKKWVSHVRTLKVQFAAALREVARSSCRDFLKKTRGRCPRGFKVNHKRINWICKGQGCIRQCCTQTQHTCRTFHMAQGCPGGYRPNTRTNTRCSLGQCRRTCCENSRIRDGACRSWGDPHLITFDGAAYDCQMNGELVYYDNELYNERVHVMQYKYGHLAYVTGAAFQQGRQTFSLNTAHPRRSWGWHARFNGRSVGIGRRGSWNFGPFHVHTYSNVILVTNKETRTRLRWWYSARHRSVYYWNFDIQLPFRAKKIKNSAIGGLCGNYDRNRGNDIFGRNRRSRCHRGNAIHCCRQWSVPRSKSLFSNPPRPSPREKQVSVRSLCGNRLHLARRRCHRVKRFARNSCMIEYCASKGSAERAKALALSIKESKKGRPKHPRGQKCRRRRVRVTIATGKKIRKTRWRRRNVCRRRCTRHKGTNLTGLCGVSRNCARGWSRRGLGGLIVHKSHYRRSNWHHGGNHNGGWRWKHPEICCANNRHTVMQRVAVFARGCGRGTTDHGLTGMLLRKSDYRKNPFAGGGGYNREWQWSHPKACYVNSVLRMNGRKVCLLSSTNRCPGGWRDHGAAGLIMRRSGYNQRSNRMPRGGWLNHGWRWMHPRICCSTFRTPGTQCRRSCKVQRYRQSYLADQTRTVWRNKLVCK